MSGVDNRKLAEVLSMQGMIMNLMVTKQFYSFFFTDYTK